jgi:hypothetical protein
MLEHLGHLDIYVKLVQFLHLDELKEVLIKIWSISYFSYVFFNKNALTFAQQVRLFLLEM